MWLWQNCCGVAMGSSSVSGAKAVLFLSDYRNGNDRFLFDFSPEAIVLRITDDPAPRFLYCFDTNDGGRTVNADSLIARIQSNDISKEELIVGVSDTNSPLAESLRRAGLYVQGVRSAVAAPSERVATKVALST